MPGARGAAGLWLLLESSGELGTIPSLLRKDSVPGHWPLLTTPL